MGSDISKYSVRLARQFFLVAGKSKTLIGIIVSLLILSNENVFGQAVWQNSTTNTGFSTSASANRPDNTNSGDLLVASLTFRLDVSGLSITNPEGWELISRTDQGSNLGLATYYKIANSTEPSSYSWGVYTSNNRWSLGVSRITGASAGTPITIFNESSSGSSSTSVEAPSINTIENNQLVLSFFANGNAGSFTSPSGSTERYDNPYTGGSSGIRPSNMLATYIQINKGATGNKIATSSSSAVWVAQQIAINSTLQNTQYPVIEGTQTHVNNSETSSHTISLPTGIQTGELILVTFRIRDGRTVTSEPSGWNKLVDANNSGRTYVYYKAAQGSSENFSIGLSGSSRIAAVSYRISNWEDTPQVTVTSIGTNPPNLNPGWEASPALYLAGLTFRESDQSISGTPTGFSNLIVAANTSNGSNRYFEVGIVQKFSSAGSEDPSSFSSGGANPTSFTIGIKGKKKKLTVSANSVSKVYGEPDPMLAYSVTGFENSDDASILTGSLIRETGENTGTYVISLGSLDAQGYSLEFTSADFSITPKTLTITPSTGQFKLMGEPDPETISYEATGFEFSDNSSILTGKLSRNEGETAGFYPITLGTVSSTSGNYALEFIAGIQFEIRSNPSQYIVTSSATNPRAVTAISISAQLADENGSAIPEAGRTVTWSELGNATGSFSAPTSVTDANGIATVDFITSPTVGVSTKITASGSGGLFGTSPEILTVDAVPTQLAFIQSPTGSTIAGQPFQDQPIIEVRDIDGNRVQSATTLVSLIIAEGTGDLRGTISLNAIDGVVSFSGLNVDLIGENKSIIAEADGLSPAISGTFSIIAAEASRLVVYTGDQQVAQVGEAVDIAPAVSIMDIFGNPVSGVSVTFSVNSGGGSIIPTNAVISDTEGIAALNSWILGSSPGENTLTASSPGLDSKIFTAIGSEDEKTAFTGNTTFTVPDGVTSIVVEAWGAGGAGGGVNGRSGRTRYGAGGGGGAYAKKTLAVSPGEILNLVIGNGGSSDIDEDGLNGESTYISQYQNLIYAEGGFGGISYSGNSSTFGGIGGRILESKGDVVIAGFSGTNGSENNSSNNGKGGNSGLLGIGASARTSAGNGNTGGLPGGGGSGGLSTSGSDFAGGSGGQGKIIITYPIPVNQFQAISSGNWEDASIWEQRMTNGQWVRINSKPGTNSQVILSGTNLRVLVNEDQSFSGDVQIVSGAELVLSQNVDFILSSGSTLTTGNEGILSMTESSAVKGQGNFILNGGGTMKIASPDGIKATDATGSIQNTGTRTFSTNATIIYNGTSEQILGDGFPSVVGNLVKEGLSNLIIDKVLRVNMNLTLNSGTIELRENLFVDMALTLNGSANLIVNPGKTLQADLLSNISTNEISKIILQPGAKYFNLGISTPRLEVRQDLTGARGWRMIGAPVRETTYQDFLGEIESQGFPGSARPNLQPNVLWWDETDGGTTAQGWRTPSIISQQVDPGRGHYVFVFGGAKLPGGSPESYSDVLPLTVATTGQEFNLNSGGFTFDISYTQRNEQVTSGNNNFTEVSMADAGFNLISNPTASYIDFQKATGWEKTNIDQTIYIWNQNKNNGNGGFELFQGANPANIIAPFQAFWIKANAPNPVLTMNNEAKSFATSSFFGRVLEESPKTEALKIKLNVSSAKMEAESILRFSPEGKDEKDEWDAYQLESLSNNWLLLYSYGSPKEKTPLAINHLNLPGEKEEKTIPLNIAAAWEGKTFKDDYLLTWELPVEWPSNQKVVLMDHISEKAIDMTKVSEYSFNFEAPSTSNPNLRIDGQGMKNPQAVVFSSPYESGNPNARVNPESPKRPFTVVIGYQGKNTEPEYRPELPKLYPPYPNPFIDQTRIRFYLPVTAKAEIKIFDVNGITVGQFDAAEYPSGIHELDWAPSTNNLPAGIYILQLITEENVLTQKLLKK
jgi:hypothetical protein